MQNLMDFHDRLTDVVRNQGNLNKDEKGIICMRSLKDYDLHWDFSELLSWCYTNHDYKDLPNYSERVYKKLDYFNGPQFLLWFCYYIFTNREFDHYCSLYDALEEIDNGKVWNVGGTEYHSNVYATYLASLDYWKLLNF